MSFADRLIDAVKIKKTPLIVGLDPRWTNLPSEFCVDSSSDVEVVAEAYLKFCQRIIDVVAPLVPAVKPQSAFFEQLGPAGVRCLWEVTRYARAAGLLVIMDAKRGDIGSTAEAYAKAFLGDQQNSAWGCDCLTVNPYLGDDSIEPFVTRCRETGSGIFVLVRTSNPGGNMLQELVCNGKKIYSIVADHVQELAVATAGESGFGSVGAVVGATNPEQLNLLRHRMPNTLFLVPGIGAQGGKPADVSGAFNEEGFGAVINSSRAIIFAHEREPYSAFSNDWQRCVEQATRDTIDAIADATTAGNLV